MIDNLFRNNKLLVAVSHNDDIEFVCGGLLHYYRNAINTGEIELITVTFASREQNTLEPFSETLAHQSLSFERLNIKHITSYNHEFQARFLPSREDDLRLILKAIKHNHDPDIIITHYMDDPNQDHQSVATQVQRVFNDRMILGGEISNTGKRMIPNFFVGLNDEDIKAKYEALQCYKAEAGKYYFEYEIIKGLARVRGGQSGCFRYAEAFELYSLHTGRKPLR
jgi:LmbE family N-acetylglucosaminyl deacetylase